MDKVPLVPIDSDNMLDLNSVLLSERMVFLMGEVDEESAYSVITKLLYLEAQNNNDIHLYINSDGGAVSCGFAIFDTMRIIKSPVRTVCIGKASSVASLILAGGEIGKRAATEHSRIMIHEPYGGHVGSATDSRIYVEHLNQLKETFITILSKLTNKPEEVIERDIRRDKYMTAVEAKDYGIIDCILKGDKGGSCVY